MILDFGPMVLRQSKVKGDDSLSHDTLENVRWLGTGWLLKNAAEQHLDARIWMQMRGWAAGAGLDGISLDRRSARFFWRALRLVSWKGASPRPWKRP